MYMSCALGNCPLNVDTIIIMLLSSSLHWHSWQDLYPWYCLRLLSDLFSGFWNPKHLSCDTVLIYISNLHTQMTDNNQATGGQR